MKAKKSFGQHFLRDATVIKKIIAAAQIHSGEAIIEVGPGHGVLTQALVEAGAKVVAVEADRDLIAELRTKFADRAEIIFSDILKLHISDLFRISKLGFRNYKVVANLPYNIATAVIEKFLTASHPPSVMVVMVQREVAERMMAGIPPARERAGAGGMSVLSVACQMYADLNRVTNVPPGAFSPPPKVESTVVRLTPHSRFLARGGEDKREEVIFLAKRGFRSRRKLLKNNLQGGKWPAEIIQEAMRKAGVDEKARPQELSVEQWSKLWYNLS